MVLWEELIIIFRAYSGKCRVNHTLVRRVREMSKQELNVLREKAIKKNIMLIKFIRKFHKFCTQTNSKLIETDLL